MALRSQIAPHDCTQEYEQSAREHQEAGLLLLAGGSAQGIALMALSAEMLLKAAYFRYVGYAPTRRIDREDLGDAAADIRTLGVTLSPQGYQNLEFWTEGLIASRRRGLPRRTLGGTRAYSAVTAIPMAAADEAELRRCVSRLAANWEIGDRYRSLEPHASKQDMEDVFDDAVAVVRMYDAGKV